MPQIQLINGELDGLLMSISSVTPRPDMYYAVPLLDEPPVRETKGTKARAAIRQKLGTLAYAYNRTVRKDIVGVEYQYVRCPEQDKIAPVDAAQDGNDAK